MKSFIPLFLLFILVGTSSSNTKEIRLALLIGNGKYNKNYYAPLKNPTNDVDELEKILEAKGFQVTKVKNADYDKMQNAVNKFIGDIRQANSKGNQKVVSLFYYGGHGNYIKTEDESYLVPIKSKIVYPEQFKRRAYPVSELLELLQGSNNFLNIVMLDACRDNFVLKEKFAGQTAGDGYDDMFAGHKPHAVDQANKTNFNLFVSYATAKLTKAVSTNEASTNNSPYVAAFKEVMSANSTYSIYRFFPTVHRKTTQKSRINRPETSIDFTGEFFFDEPEPVIIPTPKTEVPKGMVYVEGGTFEMGSEDGDSDEKPAHSVKVNGFWVDQYEVIFNQYDAFCKATSRSKPSDSGWGRGQRPVINVSWYDAIAYCNWRSTKDNLIPCYQIDDKNVTCNWTANGYRLPTEAEWEYAAGGGALNRTEWAGTSNEVFIHQYSNYCDINCTYSWKDSTVNDGYKNTSPIGTFLPNSQNIYDMSGNVWEWCWDWYDEKYYNNFKNMTAQNPRGASSGKSRVLRGGSWVNNDSVCRVAVRYWLSPYYRDNDMGFRCIRAR